MDIIKKRDTSIDLARTVAAFLVISAHSFFRFSYYNMPVNDETMSTFLTLSFFRWIAVDCVPLFFLITGYLCIKKADFKNIYKPLIPLFLLYIITEVLNALRLKWSIQSLFLHIVSFDNYTWFEQYIGLVLLIPFLNILWKALGLKQKRILIIVMLINSSIYSIIPIPSFESWLAIYPITYYCIGAYLSEKPLPIKKIYLIILFVFVTSIETLLTAFYSRAGVFSYGIYGGTWSDYPTLLVITSSVLLFSIIKNIKIKNKYAGKILGIIGKNTFGIYLFEGTGMACIVYFIGIFPVLNKLMSTQIMNSIMIFLFALVLSVFFTWVINKMLKLVSFRRP